MEDLQFHREVVCCSSTLKNSGICMIFELDCKQLDSVHQVQHFCIVDRAATVVKRDPEYRTIIPQP